MLVVFGGIFLKLGVGIVVLDIVSDVLLINYVFVVVFVYCLGMLLFMIVMGNVFVVFVVIIGGIGFLLIVYMYGGNLVIMVVFGMFVGYCGMFLMLMVVNFNIVLVMLFELKDKNVVIKV